MVSWKQPPEKVLVSVIRQKPLREDYQNGFLWLKACATNQRPLPQTSDSANLKLQFSRQPLPSLFAYFL
jgi:hypothetical protein